MSQSFDGEPGPILRARRKALCAAALAALLLRVVVLASPPSADSPAPAGTGAAAPATSDAAGVRALTEAGRYGEAEALARRLLSAAEAEHGGESREAATALDLLVRTLVQARKGGTPESLELARRAVNLNERHSGATGRETAASLGNLASVLRTQGKHAEAEEAARRALAIREALLGPEDPDVARALGVLARIRIEAGKLTEAAADLDRARAILERANVPDYPDRSDALNTLGVLRAMRGDQAGSIEAFEQVRAIREQALGPDHPEVVAITGNLGVMLMTSGRYGEARPLLERALAADEARFGPDDLKVASDLFSLGSLDLDVGDLLGAEARVERALGIRTRALGENRPEVAACLNLLGTIRMYLRDDTEARRLLERSIAIHEQTLGPSHFRVGESLILVGELDLRARHYDEARKRLEQALAILEASVGPDAPVVAKALDGLSRTLRAAGAPAEALPLQERANRLVEKQLGADSPNAGHGLGNLALVLSDLGRDAEALAAHQRAVTILEASLPPLHEDVSWVLRGLALSQARNGQPGTALLTACRAESLAREFQDIVTRSLPERQALLLAAARASGIDVALTVAAAGGVDGAASMAWDALVRSRARVLDEMAGRRRALAEAGDAETVRLAEAYAVASGRLANLLVRGADATPGTGMRRALFDGVAARDAAERAFAERSAAFRHEQTERDAGLAEVIAARPDDSALVAYAFYKIREPRPITASYLAFVLPAGGTAPIVVPLGPAAEIEPLVARWREEVLKGAAGETGAPEAAVRRAGAALRERIWDPLAPHLGDAKRIFVVPDGALHVVSLAALPAGGTEYLVERLPPLQYLTAERDLSSLAAPGRSGAGLLVVGGPAYDASPQATTRMETKRPAEGTTVALRGPLSSCAGFRALTFAPLPAAAGEAREIERLWKGGDVVRIAADQATEGAFKRMAPGRRALHLATHGYFLGPECPSALSAGEDGGDHPLRLAGLAMAGANHRREAGPDGEDGILTAEEIAALDLTGVDWAVLSACETGRGAVQAGEGVLGLRRAFQIAGVRTVVMSLWPVEDRSARAWMRRLYEGRQQRGLETASAVREATLGLLRERRDREQSTHPLSWGAFVAAGDWR